MNEEMKNKLVNKEKALSNAIKELEAIRNGVEDVKTTIPMLVEEHEINKSNVDVVLGNFELLKPNWKYETDPRYLDNMKRMTLLNVKKSDLMYDKKIKEYNDTLERLNTQLSEIEPYIDSLKKDIMDLKVEAGEQE